MPIPSRSTRTCIERVFDALPADVIGEIYCDEGGVVFFETMRSRIVEDGAVWAEALAARLGRLEGPKASLYVGAGIAELPVLLVEALDLERRLIATNLRAEECDCLNRTLRRIGVDRRRLELVARDPREAVPADFAATHVSIVSVLTDPETWPSASAITYGRLPPVLLDTKAFERERKAIRALVDASLARLALPGLVTTTGEETPWILDWAVPRGIDVEVDDLELRAAVVGDPIGFLRLRAKQASA